MTDVSRAEITNSIWVCKNCHKLIDDDPARFSANLLFEWRRLHEAFVVSKLGSRSDVVRLDLLQKEIDQLGDATSLAKQIVFDRPPGWEYRLSAELIRYHIYEPL